MILAKYSLLLLLPGFMFGQQLSHPVMASRDDVFSAPRQFMVVPETVRVLAAMVQFQEDNDSRTSGNGRFDLSATTNPIIDAPPRNQQYFRDHLTLVENYYRKVSKGKTIIQCTVINQVVTLPNQMVVYSPPRNGSNAVVGNLAVDTWRAVDSLALVPDFSAYTCFMVFHAGVGRDIDIVAALGYDPTPSDIPSLYIGLNAFRQFYGSTYAGIPVSGGSFHITNTIVAPETESRLLPGTTGDFLLELTSNGLLCASIGNFLGLPDLFDTNTGRSGIGRFGLMDGQAIFSFSGAFPPEPSAWEKYWLGWIEPITLGAGEHTIVLPAVSTSDTVYRVPISAQEYFLIENRNRDPLRNGQAITSTFNGQTNVRTFVRDTAGFESFDIELLSGVVTDVEDFDWSVPGGVTSQGEFFDGGVVIWHIDESVIQQGLASNGVNANPLRRGVDVEEADGSQDIGQEYGFLTPGSGSEEGTPLDFWFETNSAPVFTNEFSSTTHPNSSSNSGANSHITIDSFSVRGPRMSARVRVGDESVALLSGFPKRVGEKLSSPSLTIADLNSDSSPDLIMATTGRPIAAVTLQENTGLPFPGLSKLYAWNSAGTPALPNTFGSGLIARSGDGLIAGSNLVADSAEFVGSPTVNDFGFGGGSEITIGENLTTGSGALLGYRLTDADADSLVDPIYFSPVSTFISTSPVAVDSFIAAGAQGGNAVLHDPSFVDRSIEVVTDSLATVVGVTRNTGSNGFVFTASDGTIALSNDGATAVVARKKVQAAISGPAVVGVVGTSGEPRIAFTTQNGYLFLVDRELNTVPGFPVNTGEEILNSPALADIDGDGLRDIVVFSSNHIRAYNYAGASLDYFPITIPTSSPITSYPVIADVNGDGNVEIIAVSEDGLVVAYDKSGRLSSGFPLQAGIGSQSVAVFDVSSPSLGSVGIGLAVASSESGSLIAWKTSSTPVPYDAAKVRPWPQYQKDAQHTGLATEPLTGTPISSAFFPQERAYNWPNPVYDGKTFIRYFVKENASVSIRIFDLAGDLVTEFAGPGIGGVDNEVAWDVKDIQSGVYFARIEASGAGGSGIAVVKVAVVK